MAAPALDIRTDKRPPALKKWVAKKWKPEYERMVAYSAMGWSNIKIAGECGRTTVHVSNVLNLPQAKELKQKIMERMREKTLEDVPTLLKKIAHKTAERLNSIIQDDDKFEKSPFAVIDRGLDVLKGTGYLKGGGNGAPQPFQQQNNFFNMPPHLMERLNAGMLTADKAQEIHAPQIDGTAEREG